MYMLNESTNKENTNTPLEKEKDDILSEVLASGKKISFPDFNFYKIRTFCGKYVDIQHKSTEDGKFVTQYTGYDIDNQKFMIFTLDNDFSVIAAKHSGKVIDVHYNRFSSSPRHAIAQYDFHNNENQKFFISNDGVFAVKETGLVWDVQGASNADGINIMPHDYHGASHQKFMLEPSESVSINLPTRATLPPAPDFKTTNLDEILPDKTTPVITHATYIPYFMVKDPYYNAQQKIEKSPYYILVRRQYWEKKSQRIVGAGETYGYSQTTGVSRTDQTSMTKTTEISIGADLGFAFKGFSAGLSTSITETLSVTKSTSNTDSTEETITITDSNTFNHTIARAKYMLINEYYVTRADGEEITSGDSMYWKVPDPSRTVTRTIPR
nr:Tpp insecticidal protein [Bacillus thuringiensis]